jgi:hypothetical protein
MDILQNDTNEGDLLFSKQIKKDKRSERDLEIKHVMTVGNTGQDPQESFLFVS